MEARGIDTPRKAAETWISKDKDSRAKGLSNCNLLPIRFGPDNKIDLSERMTLFALNLKELFMALKRKSLSPSLYDRAFL